MRQWSDPRIPELFGIEYPILQAPMAGAQDAELAIAVAQAGGLGALPCALWTVERIRTEIQRLRAASSRPFNLNFFCHDEVPWDPEQEKLWKKTLEPYYRELNLDPDEPTPLVTRKAFDEEACRLVEELRPEVVSFHFGLPDQAWLLRIRASGAKVIASATTKREALWLEAQGCAAIIAQGFEAGGHRGMFLSRDLAAQVGTLALVPEIVDAVRIPVIASGGIADARGMIAALNLGAAAVQIGTAFLLSPEAKISEVHRRALREAQGDETVLTNVFTGRPARGLINRLIREQGPISGRVPAFPYAGGALAPLRAKAEARGQGDFSPLWAGQSLHLAREISAASFVKNLADEVLQRLERLDPKDLRQGSAEDGARS